MNANKEFRAAFKTELEYFYSELKLGQKKKQAEENYYNLKGYALGVQFNSFLSIYQEAVTETIIKAAEITETLLKRYNPYKATKASEVFVITEIETFIDKLQRECINYVENHIIPAYFKGSPAGGLSGFIISARSIKGKQDLIQRKIKLMFEQFNISKRFFNYERSIALRGEVTKNIASGAIGYVLGFLTKPFL